MIVTRTVIGYGLPTRAGTNKAHGEAPGDAELDGAKENWAGPKNRVSMCPKKRWPSSAARWIAARSGSKRMAAKLDAYRRIPELAAELERRLAGQLPAGWDTDLPEFPADAKGVATRAASGKVLNALAKRMPELIGGSADLAPSTSTWLNDSPPSKRYCHEGRNFHFGVREHGMGSAVNGMAYHGGLIPFGATFMVFADYMRPPVRLAALSHLGSIWVFTHDSIGVGEDGPTHQPVEHLASLRAIPNLLVLRPGDANEVREAWKWPSPTAPPHRAGADPPESAHPRPRCLCLRRRCAERRLRAGRPG
jgi:transketolase